MSMATVTNVGLGCAAGSSRKSCLLAATQDPGHSNSSTSFYVRSIHRHHFQLGGEATISSALSGEEPLTQSIQSTN